MISSQVDLLLLTVPPLEVQGPALGPAIVASAAKTAGFNCISRDLNIELFQATKDDPQALEWLFNDYIFQDELAFLRFGIFDSVTDRWVAEIVQLNPRWVGLSLFTYRCKPMTKLILNKLKKLEPKIKVVVGGAATASVDWIRDLEKQGLIDHCIVGEAEDAIVELLGRAEDQLTPKIDPARPASKTLADISADYTDLNLEHYGWVIERHKSKTQIRRPMLYVEGSRGCVKKCSFCNVPLMTPGFRFRPGKSIALEISRLHSQYGITKFSFADSLINGSLSELKNLCEELKVIRPGKSSSWSLSGYFIVRPQSSFSNDRYDEMAAAGFTNLWIGVESGSADVRRHMKKMTTDEDIDRVIQQCLRVGILPTILMMVGYPTETEADFEQTLEFLRRNKPTGKRELSDLRCSWRVSLDDNNSSLSRNPSEIGLSFDKFGEWYTSEVNVLISAKRYFRFREMAQSLGYLFFNKLSDESIFQILRVYGLAATDLEKTESELTRHYLDLI